VSVFESIERYPAEYLPTGDRALLMAWAILPAYGSDGLKADHLHAVLCLEDGRAVSAALHEFKFDYRYDVAGQQWLDVSRIEGNDGDTDQEAGDDGRPEVPG
jgi:hypothetical protein